MNNGLRRYGIWVVVALVGAICWGMLALARGETVNAGWMLFAALASYAIAFRFSSPVDSGGRDVACPAAAAWRRPTTRT